MFELGIDALKFLNSFFIGCKMKVCVLCVEEFFVVLR